MKVMQGQREAMAVTGFVSAEVARQLAGDRCENGFIEVRPERDVEDVAARVAPKDIAEVRVGAAEGDLVVVQLILREGARVETVFQMTASPSGMERFRDPVLNRVRQEATAKKIMI